MTVLIVGDLVMAKWLIFRHMAQILNNVLETVAGSNRQQNERVKNK
jgi:hypothetical protein